MFAAIREAVGSDYVSASACPATRCWRVGWHQESLEIAVRHAESGMIDYFNVIGADASTDLGISKLIPTMGQRTAPYVEHARIFKRATGLPVFHATRITDPSTARHVIAEGFADMVGMTRAHIADLHLMAKVMRGEEDRIRPCGCRLLHRPDLCRRRGLVHPQPGHRARGDHAARDRPRRRTAAARRGDRRRAGWAGGSTGLAARGHDVVLLEATDRLGGQVNLAARLDRRREILGITGWLQREVELAGVEVHVNSYAESEDVLALEPDIVIVATGGTPNAGFFGDGGDLVASGWDVLSGQTALTGEVLVYDENGQHQAERRRIPGRSRRQRDLRGARPMPAVELGATNSSQFMKALYERGVHFVPDLALKNVRREGNRPGHLAEHVHRAPRGAGRRPHRGRARHPAGGRAVPRLKGGSRNYGEIDLDALLAGRPQGIDANPAGRYQLFRVGDAVASRNIHAWAIYDLLRLCKNRGNRRVGVGMSSVRQADAASGAAAPGARGGRYRQLPFKQPRNLLPPVDLVSADQLESIHEAALTILEEIGMDVLLPEARDIYKAAGAQVDGRGCAPTGPGHGRRGQGAGPVHHARPQPCPEPRGRRRMDDVLAGGEPAHCWTSRAAGGRATGPISATSSSSASSSTSCT